MLKDPVFQFGVFYALLCQCAFGLVPPATNVSVVCHNFVNVLYWNYSNPAEQLRFSVLVKPYESDRRTVDTSQIFLDISNYSHDAADDYVVDVTAHVGQEKSESASIRFTYSKDYYDEKKHTYKCSLDFPAVNISVHKDVIKVSFWHPYLFYEQDTLNEEFKYTVTHDQETFSDYCLGEDEQCIADIHFNQSVAGQCVELRFEGKISAIPTHTSRHVCVPRLTPHTDHTGLILALLGGGFVLLCIIAGVVWVISKKWSKIPKLPEALRSFISSQTPTVLLPQPECSTISPTASDGHKPLLNEVSYGSCPISVDEKDCETTTDLANTEEGDDPEVPEEDDEDFTGFGLSSDYNSPKCLYEMSPEDFAEGYGSRPPIL
ncbi:interferon gamma receptor 1-like [Rhinichthys klamathensis goyatoka]|uniref:interferon gamma receptor 1-like n=1 Tax=Rhinichthys klamathensis goyatoka TaxID=3034132 RepID=UPI0024B4D50C|nr:interferon gamma receptor 1-like [Rhinichthys klamathensis goyatoka]